MLPSGSEGHSWADFIQQERNLNWMSIVGCAGCRALMEKLLKTDRWRTAGGETRRVGRKAGGEEGSPQEDHDEGRGEKGKYILT